MRCVLRRYSVNTGRFTASGQDDPNGLALDPGGPEFIYLRLFEIVPKEKLDTGITN